MKKKGYILLELQQHASEKEIVKKIQESYLSSQDYCCSVVGKVDVLVEKLFDELREVDELVTRIRVDPTIAPRLARTMTYIGTQYPR